MTDIPATEPPRCCQHHHPGDLDARLHAEYLRGHQDGQDAALRRSTEAVPFLKFTTRQDAAEELYRAASWHPRNAAWQQDMDAAAEIVLHGLEHYARENDLSWPPPADAVAARIEHLARVCGTVGAPLEVSLLSGTARPDGEPERRTVVLTPTRDRFEHWCHERHLNPRSRRLLVLSSSAHLHRLYGWYDFDVEWLDGWQDIPGYGEIYDYLRHCQALGKTRSLPLPS